MRHFVTAGELAEHLQCPIIGDRDKKIYGIALFHECTDEMLTYVPVKDIDKIHSIQAGVILTKASFGLPIHRNYIITRDEPYHVLARTVQFLIDKNIYACASPDKPVVSPNCKISDRVTIGNGTVISDCTELSPGVVIGENVKIGSHCRIGSNTVIGSGTIIGDNTIIGSCSCIGTENFEYQQTRTGWIKIPAVGDVRIGDNVEIGGNVVIEKGTIGTTIIGDHTQLENLIQIGHETKIGSHCHIVACTALAGWSEIGNHVTIYGQAGVCNRAKVGNNVVILGRSGVDKDIKDDQIISGFPAQAHTQEMKFQAFLRKLFRMSRKDVH